MVQAKTVYRLSYRISFSEKEKKVPGKSLTFVESSMMHQGSRYLDASDDEEAKRQTELFFREATARSTRTTIELTLEAGTLDGKEFRSERIVREKKHLPMPKSFSAN